jgi:Fe-S cluster assembly protein SufD
VEPRLSRIEKLGPSVTFGSLADAISIGHPRVEQHLARHTSIEASAFAAANAALMTDGAFIHVGAGVTVDQPLHVLHVATSAAAGSILAPRTLILLERAASATVLETFASLRVADDRGALPPYLDIPCADIVLDEGARLEHIRVQREDPAAYHVAFTTADQQRDSHYRSFALSIGARLSRHNLHARLGASSVETLLYGLYLARGDQLVDNHTAIFHDHPGCNSWEVYKGVLAERSRGVFNGKVIVQPAAQKTDAKQTNRNLLLGSESRVDTKPQLEIFADDVKCTHGATVGKLDEQQRYYLRTRGIAGRTAEVMLITAFMAEVLAEVNQPQARTALEALVYAEMDALIGSGS